MVCFIDEAFENRSAKDEEVAEIGETPADQGCPLSKKKERRMFA